MQTNEKKKKFFCVTFPNENKQKKKILIEIFHGYIWDCVKFWGGP